MAKKAELKAVLSIDQSEFLKGIKSAANQGKILAVQFAKNPIKFAAIAGIVGFEKGVKGIAAGLESMGRLAVRGFAVAASGAVAFTGAIAAGVEHVFSLGHELRDLSAQTGISVDKLVVMQRVFKNAGLDADTLGMSVAKMGKWITAAAGGNEKAIGAMQLLGVTFKDLKGATPDQQFRTIGQAIANIGDPAMKAALAMTIFGRGGNKLQSVFANPEAFNNAARQMGAQAQLLRDNAVIFEEASIALSGIGAKLQGFFVGVASSVGSKMLAGLEKLDGLDLSGMGKDFGDGIIKGVDALVGMATDAKQMGDVLSSAFDYAFKSAGNVLIGIFDSALKFFADGFADVAVGIGQIILASLMDAFKTPIAYLQAGIEAALDHLPAALGGTGKSDEEARITNRIKTIDEHLKGFAGVTVSSGGGMGPSQSHTEGAVPRETDPHKVKKLQVERDTLLAQRKGLHETMDERAKRIAGNLQFGSWGGAGDADEQRARGKHHATEGIAKAFSAMAGTKFTDVLGQGEAGKKLAEGFHKAVATGAPIVNKELFGPAKPEMFGPSWKELHPKIAHGPSMLSSKGLSAGGLISSSLATGLGNYQGSHTIRAGDHARALREANKPKHEDPIFKVASATAKNTAALVKGFGLGGEDAGQ